MRNSSAAKTEFIGNSDAFLAFQEQLSRVATIDRPVLIIGERGTGKELAAARLHYHSQRWENPLITLNCAALNHSLLEAELFGHEAGAFTGATGRRAGRFEQANRGTLFLDEIGAMPLHMQEAILRVVEYGTFERVGASSPISTDIRIIAATNANLPQMAADGTFKPDLLDRLSFEVLTLPPLRAREGDIFLLADRFASAMAVECGLSGIPEFSDIARRQLIQHNWPGNVRELKNTIERAVFKQGIYIHSIDLNPFETPWNTISHIQESEDIKPAGAPENEASSTHSTALTETVNAPTVNTLPENFGHAGTQLSLSDAVKQTEIAYLKNALHKAQYNQRKAATLLNITYHQFRGLYRKHKQAIEAR